jgi:hypothetical protein
VLSDTTVYGSVIAGLTTAALAWAVGYGWLAARSVLRATVASD